jgi:Phage integrase, N-terminal SAM-like domain
VVLRAPFGRPLGCQTAPSRSVRPVWGLLFQCRPSSLAERYAELINNQIVPHLGHRTVQKLTALDVESWHNGLAAQGRKDGKGGLSNRTIGHAHRVLSKALKEASRFDLVMRNVATIQQPPSPVMRKSSSLSRTGSRNCWRTCTGGRCTPRPSPPCSPVPAVVSC